MTPNRHDRETYERLYPGGRPPVGLLPVSRLEQRACDALFHDCGDWGPVYVHYAVARSRPPMLGVDLITIVYH